MLYLSKCDDRKDDKPDSKALHQVYFYYFHGTHHNEKYLTFESMSTESYVYNLPD